MINLRQPEMIRKLLRFIAVPALLALSLNSCSFLKEVSTMGKCDFRVTTLDDPALAGVDVSDVKGFSDIGLADMAVISASIIRGKLPLSFTLNIEARNPNPLAAAMNKLEYIAFIDDVRIASGALDRRIDIPSNGGVATIPLQLDTDIIRLLEKDSRQALVNFGLNLADASDRPTRVRIDIKPTILIGAMQINYPDYFRLQYEFSSGD